MSSLVLLPKEISFGEDDVIRWFKKATEDSIAFFEALCEDLEDDDEDPLVPKLKRDLTKVYQCRLEAVDDLNTENIITPVYRTEEGHFSYLEQADAMLEELIYRILREKLGLTGEPTEQERAELRYLYHLEMEDPLIEWFDRAHVTAREDIHWEIPLMTKFTATKVRDFYTLQEFQSANTENCLIKEVALGSLVRWFSYELKYGKVTSVDEIRIPPRVNYLVAGLWDLRSEVLKEARVLAVKQAAELVKS